MVIGHKLYSKDETPIVEKNKYKSMIQGLQYLTNTRLDKANAVGIMENFQDDPKESHYEIVKIIFKYLKGYT